MDIEAEDNSKVHEAQARAIKKDAQISLLVQKEMTLPSNHGQMLEEKALNTLTISKFTDELPAGDSLKKQMPSSGIQNPEQPNPSDEKDQSPKPTDRESKPSRRNSTKDKSREKKSKFSLI